MEFQFVNSTVADPSVPQDVKVRNMIRKQAMKKASAERKKDGNYGKHNLRQLPVFVYNQDDLPIEPKVKEILTPPTSESSSSSSPQSEDSSTVDRPSPPTTKLEQKRYQHAMVERQRLWAKLSLAESLSAGMSAKGYEATSMKNDFNILDLATLATLHVGRFTRGALSNSPDNLIQQLRAKCDPQFTYLSFLPSRYEQVGILSDAANCVIARARNIVSPNKNWEGAVVTFYLRALRSLQKALDDPQRQYQADVLCATEVLALYELLDPSGDPSAWVRHTAGASRLIQLRGPRAYNTEFEKALFMGHTVPILTEALFQGQHCFLQQKPWQRVLRSCILDTPHLSDRSEIVISLVMLKAFIPGYFKDVSYIICKPELPGIPSVALTAAGLRELRLDLLAWYDRYQIYIRDRPSVLTGSIDYDNHCKVISTYLSCILITNRLLTALSVVERSDLEAHSLECTIQAFRLEEEVKYSSTQTSLFLAQTVGVSTTIKMTTYDWNGLNSSDDRADGVISRMTFETWNNICGRKLPA